MQAVSCQEDHLFRAITVMQQKLSESWFNAGSLFCSLGKPLKTLGFFLKALNFNQDMGFFTRMIETFTEARYFDLGKILAISFLFTNLDTKQKRREKILLELQKLIHAEHKCVSERALREANDKQDLVRGTQLTKLRAACEALARRELEAARGHLQAVGPHALPANYFTSLLLQSGVFRQLGQLDKAVALLGEAFRVSRERQWPVSNALLVELAEICAVARDLVKSTQFAERVIAEEPFNARALFLHGALLLEQTPKGLDVNPAHAADQPPADVLERALGTLRRLLVVNAQFAMGWNMVGRTFLLRGDAAFDLANLMFQRALALSHAPLHFMCIACVFYVRGDLRGTVNALLRALSYDHSMSNLWVNLGAVYEEKGQIQDALPSYRMALVTEPGSLVAKRRLETLEKALKSIENMAKLSVKFREAPAKGESPRPFAECPARLPRAEPALALATQFFAALAQELRPLLRLSHPQTDGAPAQELLQLLAAKLGGAK
eukprot:gnl/Chilomastix_cuspidata/2409.p2 GENE.gnl/Chilomastix_cuspidata/2409~~gnl/Chilomastix_cuspidata/2409.p2  ORF type:complete len:494 (+),score=242.35 gnl/Chilomastix_cuspidata/2409:3128-4609(+)